MVDIYTNPVDQIGYLNSEISGSSNVNIEVNDLIGNKTTTVLNETMTNGYTKYIWMIQNYEKVYIT